MNHTFPAIVRDVTKLFAIWPSMEDKHICDFVKQVHQTTIDDAELMSLREATGVKDARFCSLGRKVTEWIVAHQLSSMGYRGRTVPKLTDAALDAITQTIGAIASPMLVGEWVQDAYDELSIFSNQPMRIRLLATQRAMELKELLKCESLPAIVLRA